MARRPVRRRFGRDWGTGEDRPQVREHIARATEVEHDARFAMQLGEFGVNPGVAGCSSAAMWTRGVREACEASGMGWCVRISQARFRFGIASVAKSFR